MKVPAQQLLQNLISRTESTLAFARKLKEKEVQQLNRKPDAKSWSVLECLEHLSLYGDFYLPVIEQQISEALSDARKVNPGSYDFNSGILGNYFAQSMLPKENKKLNKMKTFKDKDPVGSNLEKTHLDRFIQQQEKMIDLLEKVQNVNLNKVKTPISISKLIRLKLGDTFRFVIYHNDRHIIQANNVLNRMT